MASKDCVGYRIIEKRCAKLISIFRDKIPERKKYQILSEYLIGLSAKHAVTGAVMVALRSPMKVFKSM